VVVLLVSVFNRGARVVHIYLDILNFDPRGWCVLHYVVMMRRTDFEPVPYVVRCRTQCSAFTPNDMQMVSFFNMDICAF
jgi:hypothetical protein